MVDNSFGKIVYSKLTRDWCTLYTVYRLARMAICEPTLSTSEAELHIKYFVTSLFIILCQYYYITYLYLHPVPRAQKKKTNALQVPPPR